jgi:hypothetical protein
MKMDFSVKYTQEYLKKSEENRADAAVLSAFFTGIHFLQLNGDSGEYLSRSQNREANL